MSVSLVVGAALLASACALGGEQQAQARYFARTGPFDAAIVPYEDGIAFDVWGMRQPTGVIDDDLGLPDGNIF